VTHKSLRRKSSKTNEALPRIRRKALGSHEFNDAGGYIAVKLSAEMAGFFNATKWINKITPIVTTNVRKTY